MSKIDTSVGAVGREVESLKCRPDIPAAPGANARAAGMLDSLRSELTDTQAKLDLSKQANGILVEALKSAETKLAAARDDALEEVIQYIMKERESWDAAIKHYERGGNDKCADEAATAASIK